MATQDEEFIKRLRATFKVEAEEHLQAMSSSLLELERPSPSATPASLIESIYRKAHTLKGAARAVDFSEVEAICQAIESVFSAWKQQHAALTPEAFDVLHQALDMMRGLIGAPGASGDVLPDRTELTQRLTRLIQPNAPTPSPRKVAHAEPAQADRPPRVFSPDQSIDPEKAPAPDTVRIALSKLDSRLLQSEDMLTVKAMIVQRAAETRQLTALFDQWHREWAKVSAEARLLRRGGMREDPSGIKGAPVVAPTSLTEFLDWNCDYIRSLESKLRVLAAQTDQDCHSVRRRVDDLLEDAKKLLMLPFSTIGDLFPKLVRDLCRDQNKEAELVIKGGDVEIDKRILEEMKDALIHILRNCIDHGVEIPAERERLKKPARATVTIAVSQVNGSKVEIMVSDDGAGIDLERVKESAVRRNILSKAEAAALDDRQAIALVFHSEVSTKPIVTAISGRGLGMAIVRAKAETLGGQILIESAQRVGTTLRIILPLTLATFRGILVKAAEQTFVIPTVSVEQVVRVKREDIRTAENRETITVQGRVISLARLEAVLQLDSKRKSGDEAVSELVVVLFSGDQRIAFVIDEVLREEEVLVKPFRKPLVRIRNIAGATVLGSGKAVPVLNVADLMKTARGHGAPAMRAAAAATKAPAKKVLVVEDSITSRMLLKGILESAGYQVRVAVDGVDAFTALREDQFDLVVSDVEMPRMSGVDLTSRIRADKRLSELPVVLVTALESRDERERGIDAGASAYIVKSSFDQSSLVETVRRLI